MMRRRFYMKNLILILTSIAMLSSAHAQNGKGVDGGEVTGSTEAEVVLSLTKVFQMFGVLENRFGELNAVTRILKDRIEGRSFFQYRDRKVNEMLTAINRLGYFSSSEIIANKGFTPYVIRPDERVPANEAANPVLIFLNRDRCFEGGVEKDASVETKNVMVDGKVIKQANICLNLKTLLKYREIALTRVAVFLIIHEYAHAAGYGEGDATHLQDFLSRHFYEDCEIRTGRFQIKISPTISLAGQTDHAGEYGDMMTYTYEDIGGAIFVDKDLSERDAGVALRRNRYTTIMDRLFNEKSGYPFQIRWAWDEGAGEVRFVSIENKKLTHHTVSWKQLNKVDSGFTSFKSDLVFDGVPQKSADYLHIYGSCIY